MSYRLASCLVLPLLAGAVTLALDPIVARADRGDHHLAVGVVTQTDNHNPILGRGQTSQLALTARVGREVRDDLEVFAGATGGVAMPSEGGGWFAEAALGGRWMPVQHGLFRAGVGLSTGWTRAAFENKQIEVTSHGIHVEPSLELEWRIGHRLALGLSLFARSEILVGDVHTDHTYDGTSDVRSASDEPRQVGGGAALTLRATF